MEAKQRLIERTRLTEKKLSYYRAKILRELNAGNTYKARLLYDIVATIKHHYYTGLSDSDLRLLNEG